FINAQKYLLKDSGMIFFQAMINPNFKIEDVKKEIDEAINEFVTSGCTDEEFETIKNQLEFQNTAKYLKLTTMSINNVLNYINFKDVNRINSEIKKFLSVEKKDVVNSVNEFILKKKKLTMSYLPLNLKK
ncbi:MAG: insulinase family protein, partial [Ignavibacteria bacterium]|nr:insulinase family protein [Ignavibacteria bacterium]